MSLTGFHLRAAIDFNESLNTEPKRQRKPTVSAKKQAEIRRKREAIEDAIALKHELEGFG